MRIIAGEFRRRQLLSSPGLTTRPITDRAKEILFEHIEHALVGRRVADVFAGTGSLGLEALSRGAASAVFIESDRRAFELLKKNVSALGVEDRVLCWRTDALKSSFRPKGVDAFLPYDVVFCDPPYRMTAQGKAGGLLRQALQRLAREGTTGADALLFVRASAGSGLSSLSGWNHESALEISSMEIHVYRKTPDAPQGPSPG